MDKIIEFVKEELANDLSGHNFKHIERVYNNALLLIKHEGGNKKIILTSCLLHDLVDDKLFDNIEQQKQKIINMLKENNYNLPEIEQILNIISSISFHHGNIDECNDLNLEIVRDADRLDALGAIGIIRCIEYGNNLRRPFYEDDNLLINDEKIEFNKTTNTSLSHFYDKLLKLKDYMHTYTAKQIALRRTAFLEIFLDEFYQELKNKR